MQKQDLRTHLKKATSTANSSRLPDPAEIEKLKAEWRREQRNLEIEHNQRHAELLLLRSQLNVAQEKLDGELSARRKDTTQAALRIATLQKQLEEATRAIAKLSANARNRGIRGRVLSVAATAAAAAAAFIVWTQFSATPSARSAGNQIQPIKAGKPQPGIAVTAKPQSAAKPSPATSAAFSYSFFRLGDVLSATPGKPEDILRAARAKDPSVCAFRWNNGQPALLYSRGAGLSMASTLERCAEAVEKSR